MNNRPFEPAETFDDAPRQKMPKMIKYLAGTAIGLVILAGAAGVVATQVIDQQKYKSLIVSKVEESTGYTIDWNGNISLGLMPLPHASVHQLTIKSGDVQILSVAEADVQLALAPLLSKKIDISKIDISEPVVTLMTTPSGYQTWLPKKSAASESVADGTSSDTVEKSAFDIAINTVEIKSGSVIIDNQQAKTRQEFKDINLKLHADSLSGPFDINGNVEWSGQKIQMNVTSGEVNGADGNYPINAKVIMADSGVDLSFAGSINTQKVAANGDINIDIKDITKAIKNITGTAPSLPEGIGGKAMLAGKLLYSADRVAVDDMALGLGDLSYSGQIIAEGLSNQDAPNVSFKLESTTQSKNHALPIVRILSDLNISAKASLDNDKLQIASASIKTLGNDIFINGFSSLASPPTVDLTINAPLINLDKLSGADLNSVSDNPASGSQSSEQSAPKMTAEGLGFSVPFSGRVKANIAKLTTGGQIYSDITADVVSHDGALTISDASANLANDTSVHINGKIADTKTIAGLNLQIIAKTADTEKLLSVYGIALPDLPKKIGASSLNGKFTGDLKSLGFATTISALQFNVTGQGNVGNPLDTPDISSLKFSVRHPNFNDAMKTFQNGFEGSSGFFGPLDINGQLSWGQDKVDVTDLNGKLGQTSLAGNISAITKPKTKVSGTLNLGSIILPSATNNGGTIAAQPKQSSVSSSSGGGGRWSHDIIDTAWMHAFDADLSIKAKSITQNLWRLTDANLAFKLNDGVLILDDVSAGLFGGRASINGKIQSGNGAKDPLTISATLKANHVDAQGLMSAATGKPSYTLSGQLSSVDVGVNATGSSPAALIQTLGGDGSVNGQNIVVKGVDAAKLAETAKGSFKPLERAGSLFQSFQSGQTEFTDFNSVFAIQNGIVNFTKVYFDGPSATLSSTGNVNLPKWTVDFKNTMTVKGTDIPPFDFSIRGPLDNPINSGGDLINNYLQKKLEKKATKFIEDKLGGKLNKLLGVPETTDVAPAPVDGTVDPSIPVDAQPTQPNIKEEAAKEAVKALQGLFGK